MGTTYTKGRLFYIDPNDLASFAGFTDTTNRKDNVYWNPEELNTTVDLQVIVPNRRDAGSVNYEGEEFTVSLTNVSGETNIWASFFEGDNLTGKEGDNKYITDSYTDMSFMEIKNGASGNKECLGIESVDIDFNPSFYPEVTIKFTDIHGYSLMNPTEEAETESGKKRGYRSFFNALFHFPYPRFMLSVKGPFGTRVTFMLAVNEFNSSFNSESGNFDVTVTFIGYMYGLYTDIPFNFLIMAPYIDNQGNETVSVTAEGERRLGAGQYWADKCSNGIFKTKENDAILPTFVEFLNKYNEIKLQLADKQRDLLANGGAYAEMQENLDKIESAKSMRNNFTAILGKIKDKGYAESNSTGSRLNNFDNFKGKIKFWSKDEKHACTWTDNYDECIKAESNLNKALSIPEKKVLSSDIIFLLDTNASGETKYYYVLDIGNFYSKANKLIGDLTSANDKLDSESIKEEREVIKQILGFYPNIENIYRIIFAHIDTFLHHFYTRVIDIVKTKTRNINDYSGFTKDDSDVKGGEFLPPFPAVYKGIKRREIIYPGEYGDGSVFTSENMEELKFVEDVLQATIQLHNEVDMPVEDADGSTPGEATLKFLPLCPTDVFFYLNGVSPYDNMTLSKNYDHNIEILFYYLYRGYLINAIGIESNFIYEVEAANYRCVNKIDKNVANFLKGQMMGDNIDGVINKLKELSKSSNKIYNSKMVFDNEEMYIHDETITGNDSSPIIDFFNTTQQHRDTSTERYFIHNTKPEDCNDKNEEGTIKIWDNYRTSAKYDFEPIKALYGKIEELLEKEDSDGKKIFEELEGRGIKESVKYKFNPDCYDISDFYGTDEDMVSRLYYICPDKTFDCDINKADYDDFMETAIVDTISNYTFRKLSMNYGANNPKPAFYLYLNDKDKWAKTFSKDNDGEYYRRVLYYLISCMNIGTVFNNSTNKYRRSIFRILTESKLVSAPIYILLYIGAMIHSMRWSKTHGNKHYLEPLFKFDGEIDYDYLYDIKNGDEMPTIMSNGTTSVKKTEFQVLNVAKADVLEKMFLEYADILQKKMEGNEYIYIPSGEIIENTPLDVFLVSIYTKSSIMISTNRGRNPSTHGMDISQAQFGTYPKLNIKTYISKFLEKLTDEDYVSDNTPDENENRVTDATQCSREQKLATYQSLKVLYDKWLSGYKKEQFELPSPTERKEHVKNKLNGIQNTGNRCEFDNFLFVDSFYNDISSELFINVDKFYSQIIDHINSDSNEGTYEFMAELAQDNKLLFLALPIYTNFTKAEDLANMFSPHTLYNRYDNMAESIGNTYLLMYTHESSRHIDDTDESEYGDDGFDLINSEPINVFEETDNIENDKLTIYVPSFAVSFGKQNQQYFKNISVNMDNPRMTDTSIANMFDLANVSREGDTYEPSTIGQDLFSIYSNRSYECTVTMMGCANIMPMMYFQLNNIPMFKGAYLIYSVKHNITAGNMTTEFTGMRMSRNIIPFNNHIFNFKQFGSEAKVTIASNYSYLTNSNTDLIEASVTPVTNKSIEDTDEYKVSEALKYLKENKVTNSKGTVTTPNPPYNCTGSSHICTAAVWRALQAAGIKNISSATPKTLQDNLIKCNFEKLVTPFGINADKTEIEKWLKVYAKPGDVITFTKGNSPYGSEKVGHSCIYFGPLEGGRDYISDFRHSYYVYNSLGNIVYDYSIYRHKSLMGNDGPKRGEIIWSGKAKKEKLIPIIKSVEGGWSNHPSDKGGCTMSGVTLNSYQSHFGPKTCDDLKKITEKEWCAVFDTYWNKWKADKIECQSIANLLVDWTWGSWDIIKYIKEALGTNTVDETINLINSTMDKESIFKKIWLRRKKHFDDIVKSNPSQKVFYNGWMDRLNKFMYQG